MFTTSLFIYTADLHSGFNRYAVDLFSFCSYALFPPIFFGAWELSFSGARSMFREGAEDITHTSTPVVGTWREAIRPMISRYLFCSGPFMEVLRVR